MGHYQVEAILEREGNDRTGCGQREAKESECCQCIDSRTLPRFTFTVAYTGNICKRLLTSLKQNICLHLCFTVSALMPLERTMGV